MKRLVVIIVALMSIHSNAQKRDIDVAFVNYINDFFAACDEVGVDVSFVNNEDIRVRFGTKKFFEFLTLRTGVLFITGVALGTNKEGIAILINKNRWMDMDARKRRIVIYHELMHDVFNVAHRDDYKLMHPRVERVHGPVGVLLRNELNRVKNGTHIVIESNYLIYD